MNCKKILVISLILILCLGMMPIVKATNEEFKTITLQQIADSIEEEEIKEVLEKILKEKQTITVSKIIKEGTLIIKAKTTKLSDQIDITPGDIPMEIVYDYEVDFISNGNILSSPEIKIENKVPMTISDKINYYITEKVFIKISELMGYSSRIMHYFFNSEDFRKSTIQKEGIQLIEDETIPIVGENETEDISLLAFCTYQIDLSRRAIIKDLRTPLAKAMDLYEEKFGVNSTSAPETIKGIKINRDGELIEIIREGNKIATLFLSDIYSEDNSIITSEVLNASGKMTDDEKLQQYAILYFIDCIGQAIYGYNEGELMQVIQQDTISNYKFEEDGFEKINLENGSYQYKIDINKKVPLIKEEQKPQEPQNNIVDNSTSKNETVDNTKAPGEIPQTGYELTNVIIAISLISIIIAIIAYKVKKQDV